VLRNSEGKRFMFGYVPDVFRAQYAETEEEADCWYNDRANNRRPPELLPRDEVARSIRAEVKAGSGSPHGGVFLDIASRRPAEEILRKLPSMYHQFKELADVDITREPMEVGPVQHYVMGGVEVDADSGAALVPGLFAAGEVSGGMHGSNRLGGNSLSDLLVFGRRAGAGPAGAGRRREPVHGARRGPADDERPGRHHPPRGGDQDRPYATGQTARARRERQRAGRQRLRPGLAPGPGPAQHPAHRRVRTRSSR
jgi:succinate dehydrogenase / fumarate reductase, flavoprotein subunit